jgi:glycosyltransferase involved in cell wall biosynthesis
VLARGRISAGVQKRLGDIERVPNVFSDPNKFYECDVIIVVNTDSKEFTDIDYWKNNKIDISKIKRMAFVFNFIVSPAQHLWMFEEAGVDIRLLPGNKRFYDELGSKDKYKKVSHLPKMVFESPIDPNSVFDFKTDSHLIRIGKHSKGLGSKWNKDHAQLIERINKKYPDKVIWDFMGGGKEFCESVKKFDNVILRPEFTIPVNVYLMNLDIYLFYLDWGRQECWARSQAEALMSGCPSVATDVDGGNRLQVIHGSNGYLCKNLDEFEKRLSYLIENPDMIRKLGNNARIYSRFFTTEEIIRKLMIFVRN